MATLSLAPATTTIVDVTREGNPLNTTTPTITHNGPNYASSTIQNTASQHFGKFEHDLAEEGLRWADDPDLPPIPSAETFSTPVTPEKSMEHIQVVPKGLASSRWAGEQSVTPDHNHERPNHERPKGLMASRWASNADTHMLEHKLKRELSHYGLKKANQAKNNSGSSRPTPRFDPQPTAQHSPRPIPQYAPQHSHQHDYRPTSYTPRSQRQFQSQARSQPSRQFNQGRRWNPNKNSRNWHEGLRRYENTETPRDPPRLRMDWDEFNHEVKKYGLKTLKDSRWADKEEPEEAPEEQPTEEPKEEPKSSKKVPGLVMDWEEFNREVKQYGLKTLKDSRWAGKEEPKQKPKEEPKTEPKKEPKQKPIEEPKSPKKVPGLIMDWEEFNREVKQYGLKTLKDSRWAN